MTATLFDPDVRSDPHPMLRQMREEAPVHRHVTPVSGRVFWYLTRYADVQAALRHPDLGRQLDRLPAGLAATHRRATADPLAMLRRNVFHLDPPDHTRLRRLISPAFGARTVAAIDDHITRIVGELIDDPAFGDGGVVDIIEGLALPLPVLVVAELLGFPIEDRPALRRWSDEMSRSEDPARIQRAGLEFASHLARVIAQRRAAPGDDLLSQLALAPISRPEQIAAVFQLLLAGDETSVNLIGNAVLELLRHRDQLARLRADPALIDSCVEEVIRFNGPVGHTGLLYALADVEIGGTIVPRGDAVVPVLLAANRDPAVFADPDVFDIGRTPNRHLGFGHGVHFCLGAALARMQARTAVGTLVRRFPALRPAGDLSALRWTPDLFLHGVRHLPVHLK
ncbi:cytochrome P450 [Winogradskya consettensis]|uniref:Cytochrome P450 hydroxylase n=1 Tax=Winogradskya consettensis TaxID=113560 RepID=A0A919VYF7_9ACTN|nr:cytochrome P450 [Actinoplanes consettensis]GIM73663.1 cytochrome P450 hydroxylase [Actinoplanes consettensis]